MRIIKVEGKEEARSWETSKGELGALDPLHECLRLHHVLEGT